jgi:phosphatidylglycerol---prolipoprotein diacylglyceryl transferase
VLIDMSIDPILLRLGPLQLGWHGIFSTLAVAVAVWLGIRRAEQIGLPGDTASVAVAWAIAGGFVGARLFHVLDHLPHYFENPREVFEVWRGGIAVYGAFIGGVAIGAVAAWRLKLPVWRGLDAAAPAMLVGQAIGRLGCLINGDAWGGPTNCPCGIVYWHEHALLPPDLIGVPTHPYPLYEIGGGIVVLIVLWLLRGRLDRPGSTFLVASIGYAVVRFVFTIFRQETILFWGLQEAQVVALLTGLAALGVLAFRALDRRPAPSGAPV